MTAAADTSASSSPRRLPRPPSRERDQVSDSHRLVRERIFPASTSIASILVELRESRATGTLFVDINIGGVGMIRFREEQRVDFSGSAAADSAGPNGSTGGQK